MQKMDWLKLNSKGILRGSLATADNDSQLIWIKLLAMANETRDRDGYLRFAEGKPYTHEFIAQVCHVTLDELEYALGLYELDVRNGVSRIQYANDGSIFLTNWKKYQSNRKGEVDENADRVPLAAADRLAGQQAAAARLGYLQPEAAQRGLEARQAEERRKALGQTNPARIEGCNDPRFPGLF